MSGYGIISDINAENKKLRRIYGLGLAYTLVSFFLLGAAIKHGLVSETWQDIATKFQIYTSLLAVTIGLWAKKKQSNIKINLYDAPTIEFYEQLDNNNPHAISVNNNLQEQGRKITMWEARKIRKRLKND